MQLWQDGITADFDSSGTQTLAIAQTFDVTQPIYIQATTADGVTCYRELKLKGSAFPKGMEALEDLNISFGDSFKVTLPVNIPFFGGSEISAGIETMIPVTVVAENGVIHVAVGVDLKLWDSSDSWTTLGNGSLGFEADFVVMGFMEGIYDADGNINWLDTGLILNPPMKVEYGTQTSIGPVPVYLEAILEADIQARMNLWKTNSIKTVKPSGTISGGIAVRMGGGVGLSKVVGIGGGGKGTLSPYWAIRLNQEDYFELTASLNLYAKAFFLGFEYVKDFNTLAEAVWVEIPKSEKTVSSMQTDMLTFTPEDIYNTGNYYRTDLRYLDNVDTAKTDSTLSAEFGQQTLLDSNIYQQLRTQYLELDDGTALAVWLDSADSDLNNIHVYYSFYDGRDWSDPQPVLADETVDNAPALKRIGSSAYLVWQNASRSFTEAETLDDMAPCFDISVAEFDPASGFAVHTIPCANLDMLPDICGFTATAAGIPLLIPRRQIPSMQTIPYTGTALVPSAPMMP